MIRLAIAAAMTGAIADGQNWPLWIVLLVIVVMLALSMWAIATRPKRSPLDEIGGHDDLAGLRRMRPTSPCPTSPAVIDGMATQAIRSNPQRRRHARR